MAKYQDLGFSTFQIQIVLSILVSHQKQKIARPFVVKKKFYNLNMLQKAKFMAF